MTIDLAVLTRNIHPTTTSLFLGAGASIPSGAPSGDQLMKELCKKFGLDESSCTDLTECATIVALKYSRRELYEFVRERLNKLVPTGAILTLPQFQWQSIYTTNFDRLLETSFRRVGHEVKVIRSNFDFSRPTDVNQTEIYKIHGCVSQDVSNGNQAGMTITESDYEEHAKYREIIFNRLQNDLMRSDVLFIGYSLRDAHVKAYLNEAIRVQTNSGGTGKIYAAIYERDEDRALALESRGVQVCFADLNSLTEALMVSSQEHAQVWVDTGNPLDASPTLHSKAIFVDDAQAQSASASAMSNGKAATYADIARGFVFDRTAADAIETQLAAMSGSEQIAIIVGPAGVGKTTLSRMVLDRMSRRGFYCWEHHDDFPFTSNEWQVVDAKLREIDRFGVLLVDECHQFLSQVGDLAAKIAKKEVTNLLLVLNTNQSLWSPRIKRREIFEQGKLYSLGRLDDGEISSLMTLVNTKSEIRDVVDSHFLSMQERDAREFLRRRCGADMFVCVKNIFSTKEIDHIVLQEFADLDDSELQEIYKTIAALEAAGVRVHRQLVLRLTGILAEQVQTILNGLDGIVEEYDVQPKLGIYGWQTRHQVIARLLSDYKFSDQLQLTQLLEEVIDSLNPTYHIELRTARDVCDRDYGIGRINNPNERTRLLRKLIEKVPGERVPRHRIIRNLLDLKDIPGAEREIEAAIETNGLDAPLNRYRARTEILRAESIRGVMEEDRLAILRRAAEIARSGIERFPDDKLAYVTLFDIGSRMLPAIDGWPLIESGINGLREAEHRLLDPEIGKILDRLERDHLRFGRQYKESKQQAGI